MTGAVLHPRQDARALAPIALFAYNRPRHLRMAVESLQSNPEAHFSDLIVFADAARQPEQQEKVEEVRAYLRSISGFKSVKVVVRERNFGLAESIISGVTEVLSDAGRVIVLEDDLVLSRHFLRYMNDGLNFYADSSVVASIHGYNYPLNEAMPETFFLRGADCWGWATWSRAWQAFEPDASKLLTQLRVQRLERVFNLDGAGPYIQMLEDFVRGRNDSWAVRWHAATFLRGMLTLYPGRSLISNIGIDGSGTHSGALDLYQSALADAPVKVAAIELAENPVAREAFRCYFASTHPPASTRVLHRIKDAVRRLIRA